ncbi:Ig-like domain-containing protein [Dawidia soli]|uniref:Ig-like domain-containing protein n=1 Tax=Dawidia soli TaxID=2782352 RepID=A0AAP2GJJ0_9BACT|nr:Ig-like domain-containing protein [Dawidia soli]MBT1689451.1 Ig-like domain-containing protein [Dawidia soli]
MKRKIYLLLAVSAAFMTWSCSDDDDTVHVTEVNVSDDAFTLFLDEEKTITAEVMPANAGNPAIEWSTSAADVATVDANGNVKAVAPGTAVITAKAKDNAVTGTANVTVVNGFVLGTERTEIKAAYYDDADLGETEGGGLSFYFYSTTEVGDGEDYSIWIDIPTERLNTTFSLTEEDPYNWSWWIEYQKAEPAVHYEGFGSEGSMEDVVSGTMSSKVEGGGKFTVTFDILLTDGKTLKGKYSGVMLDSETANGRVKRETVNRNR